MRHDVGARAARICAAFACFVAGAACAVPITPQELATICTGAEGAAHCARLVEDAQLKRLPSLATREDTVLKVTLYPAGVATFNDTEALNGGRTYSLWDYLDSINAVVLFTTDGDASTFTLLQRTNGRKYELAGEPKVSPDRQRLVTADFCATRCVNELAVWRVTRDGLRKEYEWKPSEAWDDATATWKDADTVSIAYTRAGETAGRTMERRLADSGWQRSATP